MFWRMNKKLLKEKSMKIRLVFLPILLAVLLAIGCSVPIEFNRDTETINPSDVIITEVREVSGFTGIEISTFGRVNLSQGDSESVSIRGSDNVVPVIRTTVRNGVLLIESDENNNVTGIHASNVVTITIVVKDLSSLTISGAADVEMDGLSTSSFEFTMSGAGQFGLDALHADSLDVTLSGMGDVEISGEVTAALIDIPGAGSVRASDLRVQTAEVNISGLGGATVWVTDQLTGEISGGGSVSYYGNPQTNTNSTGLGKFISLGSK
jgi:hypothetical protein